MAKSPYSATTEDICVQVQPFYIEEQSAPERHRWVFGYQVTISNRSPKPVRLRSRYWKIVDGLGRLQEVRGDGVVGETPLIEPGDSFEYASGAPLTTPSGTMHGTYQMIDHNGRWFDVEIPLFSLDAPDPRRVVN